MMGIQSEMESSGEMRNHSPRLPISSPPANQQHADGAMSADPSNETAHHNQQPSHSDLDGKVKGHGVNHSNSTVTHKNESNARKDSL